MSDEAMLPHCHMRTQMRIVFLAAVALGLAACLEWEMPDDGSAADAEPPRFHSLTPSGIGPVAPFDPGDLAGRCEIVCRHYDECFGSQVSVPQCENLCQTQSWVRTTHDLTCFVWSACTELWLCQP